MGTTGREKLEHPDGAKPRNDEHAPRELRALLLCLLRLHFERF